MEFIFLFLAAVAVHRIWNYELIFEPTRNFIRSVAPWGGYVFICPACNALWICVGIVLIAQIQHPSVPAIFQALSLYALVRLWMWASALKMPQGPLLGGFLERTEKKKETPPKAEKKEPASAVAVPNQGCSDCEKKKANLQEEQKRILSYQRRVVIMTTLSNFNASYSLSSCVLDQARALAVTNPNWLIQVWTMQLTNDTLWPKNMPGNVELRKVIPNVRWMDDGYDQKTAGLLAATVSRELVALGNADVITHDILFQRSFLNFAAAIHSIDKLKGFNWWHQAHSGPSPLAERPSLPVLYRYSLPAGHRFLGINAAHTERFKQHYGIDDSQIAVCPNVRDPRVLYNFSEEISHFISKTGLLAADVVQIYPVSTDRAFDKGVQHVIRIFGSIKHLLAKVRLVIVNAHANNNEQIIQRLRAIGTEWGLTEQELLFTSEHFSPNLLSSGLSAQNTQSLFQVSNLFIFPTTAEASSLVLAEAALAGNLMVLNRDVPSINFDLRQCELCYHFGTSNDASWPSRDCAPPDLIAADILKALRASSMNITKRSILAQRNLEVIGAQLTKVLTHTA